MTRNGLLLPEKGAEAVPEQETVRVVSNDHLATVFADAAGFFHGKAPVGSCVLEGAELAEIIDPYDGHVKSRLLAPCDGTILFAHNEDLCIEKTAVYKIIHASASDECTEEQS